MFLEPFLNELEEALSTHERTVKIGFMLYELLTKAGYDDDQIHEVADAMVDIVSCLRHNCASRLLNKGVDIVTIRDWLGHADISTTMIYAHLAPNKLAHAAAILDTYNE